MSHGQRCRICRGRRCPPHADLDADLINGSVMRALFAPRLLQGPVATIAAYDVTLRSSDSLPRAELDQVRVAPRRAVETDPLHRLARLPAYPARREQPDPEGAIVEDPPARSPASREDGSARFAWFGFLYERYAPLWELSPLHLSAHRDRCVCSTQTRK